ncbi:MAG: translation initiation factor IF-3 [bacterium]
MGRAGRVNEKIRCNEVRVINPNGVQLGVMSPQEALQTAMSLGLDLVEVAPDANPPVCRIMDYGKYRYEQSKKAKEARKKQTVIQIKEIKMRPKTDEHDLQFKTRNIEKFLKEGNKAKVTMIFRGREVMHTNLGRKMLDQLAEELKECAIIEQMPCLAGKSMVMILAPKH